MKKGQLQPVTAETVPSPGTAVVNPCLVKSNGLARFRMNVLPSMFPDSQIVWNIAEGAGKVEFYSTGNKGRAVNVRGKAAGRFKLEASIGDPPLEPKPYIYSTVTEEVMNPIHFIVITSNGIPAIAASKPEVEAKLDTWVANANHNGRQLAMACRKASVTYLEKPEWFTMPTDDEALKIMFAYTNNVGGIKVFCIHSFEDPFTYGKAIAAFTPGIALAAHGPAIKLFHEILHTCGLWDIYLDGVDGRLVSEALVGSVNWSGGTGTGYYPPDLAHSNLIKRLMMYGYKRDDEAEADVPLVDLEWPLTPVIVDDKVIWTNVRVGRMSMWFRNPEH